ncbi:phage tail protein [Escherichia coli]|uniref:phage tail protein n=2 Tax=Escherichia coli TaxID=562 RepID=UPI0017BDB558|nr:phage tail protein [Escherichia coli]EFD0628175.1 phage tail protein [Escherichia coli]EFD0641815.1 phage tail protein [Escherichia coli]EFD0803612.1 phage tail protein [Escherichia coli]EFE5900942.1 phage tail protein [Escherichia coli]
MTAKYFAILTNQGAARLANAAALGTKLNLTQMAVGDANGTLPTPDTAQTKLINQKRIAPLNLLTVDPANTSQIIAEQIIPENEGGFWIREIGLYDDDGILIAVANCPETYKPQLQEGSGRTQTIRMILIVSSTSAITLKIDPAVVLATRQYVDGKIIEVKGYADDLMKKHVEAANPHKQYPLIANALKEMVDAGLAGDVLKNLGLGEAAKRNVGNGQNQIPDMAAFASSLSSTGFQKLPSGLIIQWGIVNGASNYTVTYPVTFPNRSLALLAVPHTTSVAGISAMGIANCSDISKSQFYIIVGGISRGEIVKYERSCFWVAIGV